MGDWRHGVGFALPNPLIFGLVLGTVKWDKANAVRMVPAWAAWQSWRRLNSLAWSLRIAAYIDLPVDSPTAKTTGEFFLRSPWNAGPLLPRGPTCAPSFPAAPRAAPEGSWGLPSLGGAALAHSLFSAHARSP